MKKSRQNKTRPGKFLFIRTLLTRKTTLILILLLAVHIFLRFYQLAERSHLGWDEIDAAWAAKRIIVDREIVLQGPVAKGNSGIYMGPLFFYSIAPFYALTNLHPIASPLYAGFMSIVSFFVLYMVTKKIFNPYVALIAVGINTFSLYIIASDRTQSAFTLIPIISYIIFCFLYLVTVKKELKYIVHLAISTGLAFHIDFTAVFFPLIIILSLPFFPRTKDTLNCMVFGFACFLILLLPTLMADKQSNSSISKSLTGYLQTYYHGLHIRRIFQLAHDAFISLEQILYFRFLRPLVFLIPPVFAATYYVHKPKRESLIFFYLIALWIGIPWLILSTYSGELTHYYFAISRNIFTAMLAFLVLYAYQRSSTVIKSGLVLLSIVYAAFNIQGFFKAPMGNLIGAENFVKAEIAAGRSIPFEDKEPVPYLYYVLTGNIRESLEN